MAQANNEISSTMTRNTALAWFVKINSGDASQSDRHELDIWLAADGAHAREYEKLSAIWSALDAMPDPRAGVRSTPSRTPTISRRMFIGAATLAIAGGGTVWFAGLPDFVTSDHYTGTSELKTATLTDGSFINLDADTALSVEFTSTVRRIVLQRGRAFFKVAKDASRPFIVEASQGSITALGTEFVVHLSPEDVTVAVQESAVSVAPRMDATAARIEAGEAISYGPSGLGDIRRDASETETAWQRGKLIFEDQPLRKVIADLNRYRSGTIRITDKSLLDLHVSGIFDISNPDGVLDAIIGTLPVKSIQLTRYLVLLRPA
ncbi:FecR family protein [Phyllobacterium myrsinacearum]|uniref:Transmembrane sensor n=1 Tax=Phyllobacterium myrsinacearum TaxID=28101 RepID=A0A839EQY3_9HYPH|nr:FecR family protein [Phyllobacterium myrsinacearum]MBA8879010.1 transmembrane sensor [Phyllobacterium myrsinacearum]